VRLFGFFGVWIWLFWASFFEWALIIGFFCWFACCVGLIGRSDSNCELRGEGSLETLRFCFVGLVHELSELSALYDESSQVGGLYLEYFDFTS